MKKFVCTVCLALLLVYPAFAQTLKEDHGAQITTEALLKTSTSWNGNPLPEYPKGQPEITIQKIVIPPGAEVPLHMHPVIMAGVLMKGTLTVMTENNEIRQIKSGEAIAEVVNTWHHGRNEGDAPVEILVFYAGIQDQAVTIKAENQDDRK